MPGQEIDRWSEVPYYLQLARMIRDQITSGELAPGDALASEPRYMQEHGLSRGTVRRALEVLRDEGWTESPHRRGSRVAPRDRWPRTE